MTGDAVGERRRAVLLPCQALCLLWSFGSVLSRNTPNKEELPNGVVQRQSHLKTAELPGPGGMCRHKGKDSLVSQREEEVCDLTLDPMGGFGALPDHSFSDSPLLSFPVSILFSSFVLLAFSPARVLASL